MVRDVILGPAWRCRKAIDLAVAALPDEREFALVAATALLDESRDANIWRIVFQPSRSLGRELPALGGEVFVRVDLRSGETRITHGE